MSASDPVRLEMVELTKAWPGQVVSVSMVAEAGGILAVAGPSGCGKSTALRMAAGLEPPDSGRVVVGGRDVSALEPCLRGIGIVFQDYALFPHLDVAGNIEYGLRTRGVKAAERRATVSRLLDSLGLSGFERRRPRELSGGERQRVALARTLAVEPAVVLFDEPLSSLDAALRKRLRSDIVDEQRRLGFTAVYVTHDLEEAMAVGDRLAVMADGRVLQCGPPDELWERPASAVVAAFIGSGPCLPVVRVERDGGVAVVVTAAGRFAAPPDGLAALERGGAWLFFDRSSATPCAEAPGETGVFRARCVRLDYAGDSLECVVEVDGAGLSSLRLPKSAEARVGDMISLRVPGTAIRILPAAAR